MRLMGLFDLFRSQKSAAVRTAEASTDARVSLPQLCYDIAYQILPRYAQEDRAKVDAVHAQWGDGTGAYFYAMACTYLKVEPARASAVQFRWHVGELDAGHRYHVLEYPPPPPVDFSNVTPEAIATGKSRAVLAPHFSALIIAIGAAPGGPAEYYVLGQSPLGGGTTFRTVLPDRNVNLGPGPAPTLDAFLERLRTRADAEPVAAVVRPAPVPPPQGGDSRGRR